MNGMTFRRESRIVQLNQNLMTKKTRMLLVMALVAFDNSSLANAAPAADPAEHNARPQAETATPEAVNATLDAALALSKAGKHKEALAMVEALQASSPTLLAPHLMRGRIEWDQRDLVAALKAYDQALALDPDNAPAREGRLLALSRLGSPADAIAEAKQYPKISPAVVQQLYEDETALAIRRSENVYYAKPGEQYPGGDRAIALAEANLKRYPSSERSRFDLVRALNNRQRSAAAVAAYEDLQRDKLKIPAYVQEAAGSAYLAEKKPELSAQAYRAAIAADPNSFEANIGLFYALVDQNDFATAQQHIDAFAARPLQPSDKFSAVSAAIWERAFENRLDVAQSRFLALQEEAPSSLQLHVALGKVYLWRGWPRRAKQELELVTQRYPDDRQANSALIEADVALGNHRSAVERLAQLQAATPDAPDVKNLLRARTVRSYNELAMSVSGTRSKENIGNGQGLIFNTKVLGKPIGFQTRPFVHEYFERAKTDRLTADYRRLGAGVEHVIADVGVVEAEVQQEFFRTRKASLALSGSFDLNDQWQVRGHLDSNSIEVPLRARYDGTSGWQAQIGASYRASERLAVHAGYTQVHLSDQNIRRAASLRGTANLIQGPFYKGTLGLDFSTSTNSLANAAYFNPKSDRTAQLSYTSEWVNYQRYTRSFGQQLVLGIGRYAENGYATGTIGNVSYEQRVNLSDVMSLRYGAGYVRRLYSGAVSSGPEASLSFNWKFL